MPDFDRCGSQHLDVERHILDVEIAGELTHVEEARLLLVNTPQEAPETGANVNRRIHDAYHWQRGPSAVDGFGHDKLLARGDQRYSDPARLCDLSCPRTSSIDDDGGLDRSGGCPHATNLAIGNVD